MNHRSSWVLSAIVCLAISGCSDQPQTGDSERADEGLAESKPTDGTAARQQNRQLERISTTIFTLKSNGSRRSGATRGSPDRHIGGT